MAQRYVLFTANRVNVVCGSANGSVCSGGVATSMRVEGNASRRTRQARVVVANG